VETTWEAPRRQTVEMLPRLVGAMEQIGAKLDDLAAIAVATGPGSFTGLRVGMSIAKGLALARNLPLLGVPTLDIVAAAQGRDNRPLCAVLQAGRGRICAAVYHWTEAGWQAETDAFLTTWPALSRRITSPTLLCGEIQRAGVETLKQIGSQAVLVPAAARLRRAGYLADIGWRRLQRGETDDAGTLTPVYLQQTIE